MIKNMISFEPLQVLGCRDGCLIALVVVSQHLHDSIGVRKWQRTQQYRVHHAEDCRCRADAERKGQHGNDGEARTVPQPPQPVAQILADTFRIPHSGCPAGLLAKRSPIV